VGERELGRHAVAWSSQRGKGEGGRGKEGGSADELELVEEEGREGGREGAPTSWQGDSKAASGLRPDEQRGEAIEPKGHEHWGVCSREDKDESFLPVCHYERLIKPGCH